MMAFNVFESARIVSLVYVFIQNRSTQIPVVYFYIAHFLFYCNIGIIFYNCMKRVGWVILIIWVKIYFLVYVVWAHNY